MVDIMRTIEEMYNNMSEKYCFDDPRSVGYRNIESMNKRLNLLDQYLNISENSKILDYGCGSSLFLLQRYHTKNYTGCDINLKSLNKAAQHFRIPILTKENERSESCYLIHPDNLDTTTKYDYIVINGVLQDFSSIREVSSIINKLCKKLKNDGSMIIITPSNTKNSDMHEALLLSVTDLCSIALMTGRKFIIDHGSLGIHTLLKIENELQ